MIEVVYTSKDNDKSNDIIRLPKNIKQIGDIKDSRKIYIEDYAINFIEEIHMFGLDRAVGVLLGKSQKSGSDRYIFIKGAVLIPNAFIAESQVEITEHDWAEIYNNIGRYFPSQEIVGWFISLENVNSAMMKTLKKVQVDQFAGGEKVLFVNDRQEKKKYFCAYENNQLSRQNGYTIYYERNEEMQDYMVDMRSGYEKVEAYQEQKYLDQDNTSSQDVNKIMDKSITESNYLSESKVGKRQSFVNYCANVAMVVLVLFVGMYMLDSKKEKKDSVDNISATITPVVKVDGDVYPTEGFSMELESAANGEIELQSESEMESLAVDNSMKESEEFKIIYPLQEKSTETKETTPLLQDLPLVANEGETTDNKMKDTTGASEDNKEKIIGNVITVNTDGQLKKEPKATEPTYVEHEVVKGENLITICKKQYGNTERIDEVMKLNDIDDVDKIYVGQIIKLP